jgi:hypothetical protein
MAMYILLNVSSLTMSSCNALTSPYIAHTLDQEGKQCRLEECRSYAKVFRLSQDGHAWEPLGSILFDMMFNFQTCWAVALTADGLTAAVSASSFFRFNGGHVRVYSFDADSSDWIQIGQTFFLARSKGLQPVFR